MDAYQKSVDQISEELLTNLKTGLTSSEIESRLEKYGANFITSSEKESILKLFIEQILNPIVILLIGASIIAAFTGEVIESILIISIVLFMAFIGVLLEKRAGDALVKLKKLSSIFTSVIRDGTLIRVDSQHIVPGDLIYLQEGDKVPADARVIYVNDALIDESLLTGESIPITKISEIIEKQTTIADQSNMIFSGSYLVQGNLKAIIVATGNNTELGRIAKRLAEAERKITPLQVQLEKLSKVILIGTLSICTVILILGVVRGQTIIDSLIQSLSLAIAFIPEGLSAVMTVTLAIGVREMVKKNVIIKKLIAAEGLGAVSILATDKTGTITTGRMSVEKVWVYDQETNAKNFKPINPIENKIVEIIKYCNNSKGATESAFVEFLNRIGVEFEIEDRIHEHRFSSSLKRMMTLHQRENSIVGYSKGAPDILLPFCTDYFDPKEDIEKPLNLKQMQEITQKAEEYARQGYRVLCLAIREFPKDFRVGDRESDESHLVFISLIALIDPLRDEVKETVAHLRSAGVRALMITGDHKEIAKTIALDAGIIHNSKERVITGNDLDAFIAGTSDLTEHDVISSSVFARVTPEHKNILIDLFKKHNFSIAMAGDGINDALAISKSDIGIGVSNATDVVKEASDVVITGNYSALGNAVEVGRIIMFRTRLYLHFLLSGNVCQVAVFLLCFIFNLPVPLTAISLLLINVLTDAAPAMSMAMEKTKDNLMLEKPRKKTEGIINKMMWRSIVLQGIFSSLYLFIIFYLALPFGETFAQTATFTAYIFHDLLRAITARSFKVPFWKYGIFSNKFNVLSILIAIIAWILIVYVFTTEFNMVALPLEILIILFISSLTFPVLEEFIKYRNRIDF